MESGFRCRHFPSLVGRTGCGVPAASPLLTPIEYNGTCRMGQASLASQCCHFLFDVTSLDDITSRSMTSLPSGVPRQTVILRSVRMRDLTGEAPSGEPLPRQSDASPVAIPGSRTPGHSALQPRLLQCAVPEAALADCPEAVQNRWRGSWI